MRQSTLGFQLLTPIFDLLIKLRNVIFKRMMILKNLSKRQGFLDANKFRYVLEVFEMLNILTNISYPLSIVMIGLRMFLEYFILQILCDTFQIVLFESREKAPSYIEISQDSSARLLSDSVLKGLK